jgi:sulfur carrier protein
LIAIVVNGEPKSLEGPMSVADLIDVLGLGGKRIALERNGEIVPRSRHSGTPVEEGDRIEIVVAVGGG